jgi:uncharacterized membrane protein/protein-disulfide isomerase
MLLPYLRNNLNEAINFIDGDDFEEMKKNKKIIPLPFPIYFWTIFCLGIAGMADSIYLLISHYRVYTDIGYRSFCAISKAINCDTVSQSPYSIFLGLPLPVWGIIGYAFFLLFLPLAKNKDAAQKRIWTILFLLALVSSVYSVILALISTFIIHSYCIMCIVIYAISFLLLFYTWVIRKRFESGAIIKGLKNDLNFLLNKKSLSTALFGVFVIGFILVRAFFPAYWNLKAPQLSAHIPVGVTENGHPWIGAEKPELTINEFTDYQCFQCKKMHFFLRQLVAKHPDKIRLIHRHFPMDHQFNPIVKEPFHVGSGKMALLAIYAATRDKFWEMNDILFDRAGQIGVLNVKALADEVGIDFEGLGRSINDPAIRLILQRDIWNGLKLNISGTPAFVINDKVYLAQIPPEVIKEALKD